MKRAGRAVLTVVAIVAGAVPAASAQAFAGTAPTAPPGYQRVSSSPIPIPPGQFDSGSQVACPAGTVPWGGSTGFTGGIASLGENINTSAPTGNGWRARYNNTSNRPTDDFVIHAICAAQPPGYTTAFRTVDNPAGTQSSATATCPPGTRLLSGGTLSTADSSSVSLLSAWPKDTKRFKSVMWNGSGSDAQLTTFATCAHRPPGYTIKSVTGSDTTGGPVTDVGAAHCRPGTSLIGGGIRVASPRPSVNLGASLDDEVTQWLSEVVNAGPQPATVTVYAICAA
jgi:hypothetical protein